jgi:hypothetical protein
VTARDVLDVMKTRLERFEYVREWGSSDPLHAAFAADVALLIGAVEAGIAACDRVVDNTDGHKPPGPPHPTREQATAVRISAEIANALNLKEPQ